MITFKTLTTSAACLTFTAALATATVAHAGPSEAPKGQTVEVTYDDLNLASKAGQDILDRRIKNAAEKVCGLENGMLSTDFKVRSCRRDTVKAASASRDLAIAEYTQNRLARASQKALRMSAQ
ncbi:MAG: UrcA family protein [Pseudomonadota bacterium]